MMAKLFGRANKKNDRKYTALYEDIKKYTIKVSGCLNFCLYLKIQSFNF